ncbi:endonuclease III, partial [Rhizobium leguminosarum]
MAADYRVSMANPKIKSVTKTPQDANVIARRKPAAAV